MRRERHPRWLAMSILALVIGACTGDAAPSSTSEPTTSSAAPTTTQTTSATTTTAVPVTTSTTSTTSTTTTVPSGSSLLVREDDRGATVEAVQFLLRCSGADVAVDGVFGPGTRAAVEAAQERLGLTVDGVAGDQTIAALSRECSDSRPIEPGDGMTVVGNITSDDPERYTLTLISGSTLTFEIADGVGLTLTLRDPDGNRLLPQNPGAWTLSTSGTYDLEIGSPTDPTNFAVDLAVRAPDPQTGEWVLETDGITFGDTTLAIGDDADTVIDRVFEILGHGVRDAYEEFDTGWYTINDPAPIGLRGVFIEGLAFLFFGPPDPDDPDRPETLARIRFEGPSDDADGNPRPPDYVTTAEGITVGDPLVELLAVYGDAVGAGSNDEEFYYRFGDSGGELCFYFGAEEPEDRSPILEIATECRS